MGYRDFASVVSVRKAVRCTLVKVAHSFKAVFCGAESEKAQVLVRPLGFDGEGTGANAAAAASVVPARAVVRGARAAVVVLGAERVRDIRTLKRLQIGRRAIAGGVQEIGQGVAVGFVLESNIEVARLFEGIDWRRRDVDVEHVQAVRGLREEGTHVFQPNKKVQFIVPSHAMFILVPHVGLPV